MRPPPRRASRWSRGSRSRGNRRSSRSRAGTRRTTAARRPPPSPPRRARRVAGAPGPARPRSRHLAGPRVRLRMHQRRRPARAVRRIPRAPPLRPTVPSLLRRGRAGGRRRLPAMTPRLRPGGGPPLLALPRRGPRRLPRGAGDARLRPPRMTARPPSRRRPSGGVPRRPRLRELRRGGDRPPPVRPRVTPRRLRRGRGVERRPLRTGARPASRSRRRRGVVGRRRPHLPELPELWPPSRRSRGVAPAVLPTVRLTVRHLRPVPLASCRPGLRSAAPKLDRPAWLAARRRPRLSRAARLTGVRRASPARWAGLVRRSRTWGRRIPLLDLSWEMGTTSHTCRWKKTRQVMRRRLSRGRSVGRPRRHRRACSPARRPPRPEPCTGSTGPPPTGPPPTVRPPRPSPRARVMRLLPRERPASRIATARPRPAR